MASSWLRRANGHRRGVGAFWSIRPGFADGLAATSPACRPGEAFPCLHSTTLPGAEQRLRSLRAWALAGGVLLLRPYFPLNFLPGWVLGALLLWAILELLRWIWVPAGGGEVELGYRLRPEALPRSLAALIARPWPRCPIRPPPQLPRGLAAGRGRGWFGTDGIRGRVGQPVITPALALQVGYWMWLRCSPTRGRW
jgi:hypothetical protein